jgi:hypothetical protein
MKTTHVWQIQFWGYDGYVEFEMLTSDNPGTRRNPKKELLEAIHAKWRGFLAMYREDVDQDAPLDKQLRQAWKIWDNDFAIQLRKVKVQTL